eukprot:1136835-Pelagomonas_calceolata.AAC.2
MMQVPAAQQKKGLSVLAAQQRKGLSIPAAQQKKGLSVLTLNTSDGQVQRLNSNMFEHVCLRAILHAHAYVSMCLGLRPRVHREQHKKNWNARITKNFQHLPLLCWYSTHQQPSCRTPGNTFEDQCNIQRAGISSTLRGLPHSPNILCLQELQKPPSHLAGAYELLPLAASSHRGKCMTLLHKESTLPDTRLIKQEAQGLQF